MLLVSLRKKAAMNSCMPVSSLPIPSAEVSPSRVNTMSINMLMATLWLSFEL